MTQQKEISQTVEPGTIKGPLRANMLIPILTVALAVFTDTASAAPLDRRPADFFSSISEKDGKTCAPVLQSLNKENALPPELNRALNPNFVTDLLLASDLQVPWQRRTFRNLGHPEQLDHAVVDLASTGHGIPVVRWDYFDNLGYRNKLFLPSAIPDEFTSDKPLPNNIVAKHFDAKANNELKIEARMSEFWTQSTYPSNGMFDFNLVKVGGKVLLLAAGSQDAERTATDGGGFDAFVMEYHSTQDITVVCHFRGGDKKK